MYHLSLGNRIELEEEGSTEVWGPSGVKVRLFHDIGKFSSDFQNRLTINDDTKYHFVLGIYEDKPEVIEVEKDKVLNALPFLFSRKWKEAQKRFSRRW